MGSSSFSLFSLLFISIFVISVSSSSSSSSNSYSDPAKDVYEVLKSHGLPIGLLPKGVTEFSLNEDGRFEVHLDQACNIKFENVIHYDRNVTGVLSYGQIRELTGIQAQELFLWFPVNVIHVDIPSSGLIYFKLDVVDKQFSLSLFETPPDCTIVGAGRVDPPDLPSNQNVGGDIILETVVTQNLSRKLRNEKVNQRVVQ
ncbi:hypothetical protein C5167_040251 [Papaver somniferum]|uniref:DUF538 domain-containing protein n=1 Tax=Papaver somniferum TaxID=3469 RepID=A0A4Y7IIN8_PAPSO|nr:uncharacterized protein LOC113315011 [Papaver somniferum]RZC47298.1 hypothetical protein C5167_040251 [Papaver somniferum]